MANIGTTNVPAITWGDLGPVAPSGPAILTGVQADYDVSFNVSFNFDPTTPQGQLTGTTAAIINYFYQLWVYYANQVDPAYASGRMQDAIARIYFLERNPAEPTVVEVVCTGLPGTVIPVGALAQATDGNLYASTGEATIGSGGTATLSFACTTVGPIACPEVTLTRIYRAIPGWDTINNPSGGSPGRDTETRADFELRRAASVAHNSVGSLSAVLGAVLSVDGVLDAYVTENSTNSPVTIGGVSIAAHSIYVAAIGGASAEVANAIFTKKAPGCGMTGSTTVVVTDTNPAYSPPYPTYDIKFQRPSTLDILFQIVIADSSLVPANAITQVQDAILAAFAGDDGGVRPRIGSTIYASRFMPPVLALGAWAQILSLKVDAIPNHINGQGQGTISGTTLTITSVAVSGFAVGQLISGANVARGTLITALGTGTGGTGTYTVDQAQTVGSQTITGISISHDDIALQIDQTPVIYSADIVVDIQ
jgi:uncharacterized phage protein gp47/JayE